MKRLKGIITVLLAVCIFTTCSEANPVVGVYKYEDNPTTLEGTWHLAQANFSFGGIHEFAAGDVTVYFL